MHEMKIQKDMMKLLLNLIDLHTKDEFDIKDLEFFEEYRVKDLDAISRHLLNFGSKEGKSYEEIEKVVNQFNKIKYFKQIQLGLKLIDALKGDPMDLSVHDSEDLILLLREHIADTFKQQEENNA